MMALSDELFGREVLPRVLSGHPVDRTIQVSGDASGRYGLQRGQRVRLRCHLIQGTSATEESNLRHHAGDPVRYSGHPHHEY